MRLDFPSQNVGGIDFLSPVTRSDRHVDFSYIRNLLVYASSSHCIPLLMNSSIVQVSQSHWGFRFGVFLPIPCFYLRGISICWLYMKKGCIWRGGREY